MEVLGLHDFMKQSGQYSGRAVFLLAITSSVASTRSVAMVAVVRNTGLLPALVRESLHTIRHLFRGIQDPVDGVAEAGEAGIRESPGPERCACEDIRCE